MKLKNEKILLSIAKKMTPEVFADYFETKELPAVKLSDKEMKYLQGGGLWKDFTGKTFKE